MGRKKKKSDSNQEDVTESDNVVDALDSAPTKVKSNVIKDENPASKSGYMMTSHSGEIIQEDIYVSDGSEDSDDLDSFEIVLAGSRMGVMRRGLHHLSALQQPNRQWVRQTATESSVLENNQQENVPIELTEEEKRKQEEEELAKLDPAQRAARLLIEKQRKLEEAKDEARQKENEENAGKDPTLFSKRTAFDIRFDQIDDKPWTRGSGDVSDFFNYGMSEDDWIEYAHQQIVVRQELMDASRQKRLPDPAIVPVQIRSSVIVADQQLNQVLANNTAESGEGKMTVDIDVSNQVKDADLIEALPEEEDNDSDLDPYEDIEGGAWGAGAPPGSLLDKLIKEQNQPVNENTKKEVTSEAADVQQASSFVREEHTDRSMGSDHESVNSRDVNDQERHVDKKTDYNSASSNFPEKRYKQDYTDDPKEDGSNSVSSGGRRYRKRPHNSSQRDDYYYGSRNEWPPASTVPPTATSAPRSYYSQPTSHTLPPPPSSHPPYVPLPVGDSFRGRGGSGRNSFAGGRFSSARGRGGRAFPEGGRGGRGDYNPEGGRGGQRDYNPEGGRGGQRDYNPEGGRGGRGDYNKSGWKRQQDSTDPRWRR